MLVLALLALNGGFGQTNLISNGNFESGTLPTAHYQLSNATGWSGGCAETSAGVLGLSDLIDSRTTHHLTETPMSGHINPRNVPGNNRFAAFSGKPAPLYGRSIKGTITSPLTMNSAYTVSFYAALWNYPSSLIDDPIFQIQVLLRKDDDCTAGKVVYTTSNVAVNNRGDVPTANWTQYTNSFTLTQVDINAGYNRLEIRATDNTGWLRLCIDDVSLTAATASFQFANEGQTTTNLSSLYGAQQVTEACLPNISINGASSTNESGYHIYVAPFNLTTWTAGTPIYNQWVCTSASGCQVPTANINLTTLSGASFVAGQVYIVTLSVGPTWVSETRFIRPKTCTSTASFVITSPGSVSNVNSPYGLQPVKEVCTPNVFINGSASMNESNYYISIQKFDIASWTYLGPEIYAQWATPAGPVPTADINLAALPGVSFDANSTYIINLSVGPDWNSKTLFVRPVTCFAKSAEATTDEITVETQITVFPNPADDVINFTVSTGDELLSARIFDMSGKVVKTERFAPGAAPAKLDISQLIGGMYVIETTTVNGDTERTKITKK